VICVICDKLIRDKDRKRLYVHAKWYSVHKECLRKSTRQKLIEKGLIKITVTDPKWLKDKRD